MTSWNNFCARMEEKCFKGDVGGGKRREKMIQKRRRCEKAEREEAKDGGEGVTWERIRMQVT